MKIAAHLVRISLEILILIAVFHHVHWIVAAVISALTVNSELQSAVNAQHLRQK